LVLGRDLIVRSLAFQACFVSAAAVASRFGAASVAAHQLVLQLWNFLALTLDSLAIAAQTLVGSALGARNAAGARAVARRVTGWSEVFALVLAAAFAAGAVLIPPLFTTDAAVLDRTGVVWWYFVAMIPVAGVVFALDGVLLGAGDAAYLRTTTLGAALAGDLALAGLRLGDRRNLVRVDRVHAVATGGGERAGAVRALDPCRCRNPVVSGWPGTDVPGDAGDMRRWVW
jgi:Na+-driven multidrug efflux pump